MKVGYMKYNVNIEIAILEVLWGKLQAKTTWKEVVDEVVQHRTYNNFAETDVNYHMLVLGKAKLIDSDDDSDSDLEDCPIEITLLGLKTLREAKLITTVSNEAGAIHNYLLNS